MASGIHELLQLQRYQIEITEKDVIKCFTNLAINYCRLEKAICRASMQYLQSSKTFDG